MRSNAYPSFTSYDYQPAECVPVIASFDSDGHIAPLYVRINGRSLKVDSYWVRATSFHNIITFSCKVIDGDALRPVVVEYHLKECVWVVENSNCTT